MNIRAIAWLALFAVGVLASFSSPFNAMLVYLLDYYEHPPLRWWGRTMPDLRWALLSSGLLLVVNLMRGRQPFGAEVTRHGQTRWLLGFLLVAVLVTPFAVDVDRSLHYMLDLAKLVLLYGLVVVSVRNRDHFRNFVLAMIIGSCLWGLDSWLDPSRADGRLQRVGGPDSYNDNSAAAHLLPVLPFLALYLWKGTWWRRIACLISAPLIVNTLILCNSRGATIGIGMMGLAGVILVRGRLRLIVLGMLVLGGLAAWSLVDQAFIDRQVSTIDYEEDGSAMGRIESWKGALNLMADHPFGTGGGGFDVLSPVYIPIIVEAHGGQERAVHNTYLWVGSDWGFLGLFLFLMFIGTVLVGLFNLGRQARDTLTYLEAYCLLVGMIGFLTAAFFINRPYAEILYWMAGLTAALKNIQRREAEVDAAAVATAPPAPPHPALRPLPWGATQT